MRSQMRLLRRRLVLHVLIRIKMRRIERIPKLRNPRRRNRSPQQLIRIDRRQPRMVPHIHIPPCETPEPIRLTPDDEMPDEVLGQIDDGPLGKDVLDLHDALEEADLVGSVGVEGRAPDEHFVDEYAECPVVDSLVVSLGEDDFGREVLGRAAEGVGLVHNDFGESEVYQHAVSLGVDEDVLRFEIAVADVAVVQVAE